MSIASRDDCGHSGYVRSAMSVQIEMPLLTEQRTLRKGWSINTLLLCSKGGRKLAYRLNVA